MAISNTLGRIGGDIIPFLFCSKLLWGPISTHKPPKSSKKMFYLFECGRVFAESNPKPTW